MKEFNELDLSLSISSFVGGTIELLLRSLHKRVGLQKQVRKNIFEFRFTRSVKRSQFTIKYSKCQSISTCTVGLTKLQCAERQFVDGQY